MSAKLQNISNLDGQCIQTNSESLHKAQDFVITNTMKYTYIITTFKSFIHFRVHVVMVKSHEEGIDDNTESDEKLDERVEHYEGDELLEFEPWSAAVPDAEDIDAVQAQGNELLFSCRLILLLFCREIVGDCDVAITINAS